MCGKIKIEQRTYFTPFSPYYFGFFLSSYFVVIFFQKTDIDTLEQTIVLLLCLNTCKTVIYNTFNKIIFVFFFGKTYL